MIKILFLAIFVILVLVLFIIKPELISDNTKRLQRYAGLKTEDIDNIPDEELETAVTEWLFAKLDNKGTTEVSIMKALPGPCRYIYAIYVVTGEIYAGGFATCFSDMASYILSSAVEGFLAVGAENHARTLEAACGIAGKTIKTGGRKALEDLKENAELSELAKMFMENEEAVYLPDLVIKYIRENKEYFGD